MASDVQTGSDSSLTGLVTGIIHDAQELFKQQLALLKHEVRDDMRKTRDAVMALAVGLAAAAVGALLLAFGLAYLLHWATDGQVHLWASFLIVGGTFAVVGGILCYMGKKRFDSFNPLPDETAGVLKENVQWIVKPKE